MTFDDKRTKNLSRARSSVGEVEKQHPTVSQISPVYKGSMWSHRSITTLRDPSRGLARRYIGKKGLVSVQGGRKMPCEPAKVVSAMRLLALRVSRFCMVDIAVEPYLVLASEC